MQKHSLRKVVGIWACVVLREFTTDIGYYPFTVRDLAWVHQCEHIGIFSLIMNKTYIYSIVCWKK
jgi:hypothetical protein